MDNTTNNLIKSYNNFIKTDNNFILNNLDNYNKLNKHFN